MSIKKVGVLGGTFDPVHKGHIQMALEAKAVLGLDELRLIPCHQPYHREQAPSLSSEQRLHLLSLAIRDIDGLMIDDRELARKGPTYTVDTLLALRQELGDDCALVLLMGVDAYQSFERWHRWQEIERLAHIGVITRPGYELASTLAQKLLPYQRAQTLILEHTAGESLLLPLSAMPISATEVRAQLANGQMPDTLSAPVADFIRDNRLYGFTPSENT